MLPIFKWSGGKRKEIKYIKEYMPNNFDTYYEPFIGGGALWFNLEHNKNVINDDFFDVTNFYQNLKDDTGKLISDINEIAKEYNSYDKTIISKDEWSKLAEKYYYNYRKMEEGKVTDYDYAIRFYLLRQLSYSGMLRYNKQGKMNAPFGWYKRLKPIEHDIHKLKKILDNTIIHNTDWLDSVSTATENDFVFIDPPYTRVFQDYSPDNNFNKEEHMKLSDWIHNTKSKVMIIINKDDFTDNLYKDLTKIEYNFKYNIQYRDRMTEKDSNSIHILATNY